VPDAEVHWPPVTASSYPDERWAIEVELTPKGTARTEAIMTGLLTQTVTDPNGAPLLVPWVGDRSGGAASRWVAGFAGAGCAPGWCAGAVTVAGGARAGGARRCLRGRCSR